MEPTKDLLNNELQISPATQSYLRSAGKWGKFLSIIGFIVCGFIMILSFFMGPIISSYMRMRSTPYTYMNPLIITVLYIFLSLIFFFPCLYLFRFSGKIQDALENNNQENFDSAFLNLQSVFKFYGVVTIIILSFYVLVFIAGIILATMR